MRVLCRLCLVALLGMPLAALSGADPASAQDGSTVATPGAVVDGCEVGTSVGTPVAEAEIDPTTLDLDLLYIDILIPHHEAAVAMAEIARFRSTRPEVVSLAATIADTQTRELEQLRAWREAWYPDVPALSETLIFAGLETKASSPGRGGAPGLDDLATAGMRSAVADLCEAPEPFDLAFIDHMVEHHTGAVLLSELVAAEAIHPEMAQFARTVVDTQSAEIVTMLGWRDVWYGGYPTDHHGDKLATPSS